MVAERNYSSAYNDITVKLKYVLVHQFEFIQLYGFIPYLLMAASRPTPVKMH